MLSLSAMSEYVELGDAALSAAEVAPDVVAGSAALIGGGVATGYCRSLQESYEKCMVSFKTARPTMHHATTVVLPGVAGAGLFYADLGFDVVLACDSDFFDGSRGPCLATLLCSAH